MWDPSLYWALIGNTVLGTGRFSSNRLKAHLHLATNQRTTRSSVHPNTNTRALIDLGKQRIKTRGWSGSYVAAYANQTKGHEGKVVS